MRSRCSSAESRYSRDAASSSKSRSARSMRPALEVIETEGEGRLVAQLRGSLFTQPGMQGDGAIDLAPPPEQAAERS